MKILTVVLINFLIFSFQVSLDCPGLSCRRVKLQQRRIKVYVVLFTCKRKISYRNGSVAIFSTKMPATFNSMAQFYFHKLQKSKVAVRRNRTARTPLRTSSETSGLINLIPFEFTARRKYCPICLYPSNLFLVLSNGFSFLPPFFHPTTVVILLVFLRS